LDELRDGVANARGGGSARDVILVEIDRKQPSVVFDEARALDGTHGAVVADLEVRELQVLDAAAARIGGDHVDVDDLSRKCESRQHSFLIGFYPMTRKPTSSFASPPSPVALISTTYSPAARPAIGSSISSTCDPVPCTEMRSCSFPGGTSKLTRCGVRIGDAGASGTRPRNDGDPSPASAMRATCDGSSPAAVRSPGSLGSGSQTNVTRVFPFSPRDVPIQLRTTLAREGRAVAALIAASTGLGTSAFGGAVARLASSGVR